MGDTFAFGSRGYVACLGLLLLARGADFLSTWVASPNLLIEGNPFAKKLGWYRAIVLNLLASFILAFWLLPAVIVGTMSLLLASRNFQLAWLIRAQGEESFLNWYLDRYRETPPSVFILCLFAQTALIAAVGIGVMLFATLQNQISLGIGMGIVVYAIAISFYTLHALWRNRNLMR